MTALPRRAAAPLQAIRERIERIDLSHLLGEEERPRALWLDRLYRNFLFLCAAYPDQPLAPAPPVDAVWRAHASEPECYSADCLASLGWVPPLVALPAARDRYERRHREELGVDPLLPDERELIDEDELREIAERCRHPGPGARPAWDAVRHRMPVSGDVAHWSGDLQVRIRRDGLALVEWEGEPAPRPREMLEQLTWIFGRSDAGQAAWPLVIALGSGGGGEVVLARASAVWRCLRHQFSADLLESAAAPGSLVLEVDGRHVAAALLPRLSRSRRGLSFATACARVFAAPGVGAIYRAVGDLVTDPDLQLRLALAPGQLLVLDHLSWRTVRTAGALHRIEFASPGLVGIGLGFKMV